MKKVTVNYSPGAVESTRAELEKIFAIFSGNGITHLEINLILEAYAPREVGKIICILCKMPVFDNTDSNMVYTFVLRVSPDRDILPHIVKMRHLLRRVELVDNGCSDLNFKKLVTIFRKRNVLCSLCIGTVSSDELKMIGKKSITLEVTVFAEDCSSYDSSFFEILYEWIHDKQGGRINLFADILTKILLDDWGTKCQYKSCLTKYFYIDSKADIYICTNDKKRICNLFDVELLQDIYTHRTFLMHLEQAVRQREKCKEKCEYYAMCHGGCPIQTHIDGDICKEKYFFSEIVKLRENMCSIVQNEDYQELNPVVRDLILSSAASGKLFEMGLYP